MNFRDVTLISNGFKSFLFLTHFLSMELVICVLILHKFGSVLNTYGSNLMSIHHSYFYTYQFSPVAHSCCSLALYPHKVVIFL